jgi:integrase
VFNWAIGEGYDIPANPVTGTNKPLMAEPRNRVLSDAELRAIWHACKDDDYGQIVRLLMLTAQRRDEVGGMRWSEVAGNLWTLPSIRTKNHREHILPLAPSALALIEAQPHCNDRDFIFGDGPRRKGGEHRGFSGWSKAKAELDTRILAARRKDDSDASPLPHWTLHDLRRTAATVMADRLAVLPHIVEAILNHVSGHRAGVAGVYNRARYEAEMREALDRWACEVSRIVADRAAV